MDVPKKLHKDLHYQLLQLKKKNEVRDSTKTLRQLIALSDVHCSQQNMSTLGLERYKGELFAEYFKLLDSRDFEFQPPLSIKSGIKKPNHSSYTHKCLNELEALLKNFGVGSLLNSESINQQGNKSSSNFFLSNKESKIKPAQTSVPNLASSTSVRTSMDKMRQVHFNNSSNASKFNQLKKSHPSSVTESNYLCKLPTKNRCEDQPETSHRKKKCILPKLEPKTSESSPGFVSASKMYRNPLKKNPPEDETNNKDQDSEPKNEVFKNFDKKIVDIVLNEIMDFSPNIRWTDIAGLDFVKRTVQEIVIWPLLRPDIFTGLRAPPRGILLFGPPGTGKTLIGKCIATESNSTFFCISASSLASKWVGESEQMVRVLFAAARLNQPAVIFIDEIDSLLSQRSDKDQDFTRKLKTEFLVQFDGAKTNSEERVLVVGATNRPHELDEAARRRFVKRLFVPLPNTSARKQIIQKLLNTHEHNLTAADLQEICKETEGYSGSDVAHLCKEGAMGPIRSIGPDQIKTVSLDHVRPIALCDFKDALRQVRASVVADDLDYYIEWNKKFGSFGIPT